MPRKKNRTSKSRKIFHQYILAFVVSLFIVSGFFYWNWANSSNKEECANSISCINDLSGKIDPTQKEGEFMGQKIKIPELVAQSPQSQVVLGDSSSNKHIYIDLTNQKLYAKEGDKTIYEFLVSTGKWGRTPTGNFITWIKLRAAKMEGGSKALGTYYYLPNVPYIMYFHGSGIPKWRGYGIHGAYWHNNFGHPMSHGCINMRIEEARLLYDWASPPTEGHTTLVDANSPGTPITIYGTAPWQ
ncbi:MAG: L,D-transpeptidase [Candidatus Levybacteria bacterium]|nr:L,D-transpeptidase [Candidatus Levybacteria bacterium]